MNKQFDLIFLVPRDKNIKESYNIISSGPKHYFIFITIFGIDLCIYYFRNSDIKSIERLVLKNLREICYCYINIFLQVSNNYGPMYCFII